MTDPTIPPAAFDIDRHIPDPRLFGGWIECHFGDITMRSFDRGVTWERVPEPVDCQGIEAPIWDRDSARRVAQEYVRASLRWHITPDTNWSDVEIQDGAGRRLGRVMQTGPAIRFDDTPGPDGTGVKSGIMLTVPAEGWPEGWEPFATAPFVRSNGRSVCPGEPTAIGWSVVLPNTEPGRIAAWALEGR